MKKLLFFALLVVLVISRCSKSSTPDTPTEVIMNHYETIVNTNDTSVIRSELAELEKLTKDKTLSRQEQMYAQYTYNVSYGLARLALSGASISVFDFPEIDMLKGTISEIGKGKYEIEEIMVSESAKFVKRVEEFLK